MRFSHQLHQDPSTSLRALAKQSIFSRAMAVNSSDGKFRPFILAQCLALCLALTLTACGRRGEPSPPGPPSAVTYPHVYPSN